MFLNTLDLLKQPNRIFQNAEQRFQSDCQEELHRRTYGRPWSLGNHFFAFMQELGLEKHHRVLDFGCGSGRLGIHLIHYLDAECYFGIESHTNSLRAFAGYEIPKLSLEKKHPRLLLDRNFSFDHFQTQFDFIIETSVTQHIYDATAIEKAYRNIGKVLAQDGTYIVSPRLRWSTEKMQTLGLQKQQDLESVFLEFEDTRYTAETYWSMYRKY